MNRWIAISLSAAALGLSSPSLVLAAKDDAGVKPADAGQSMWVMFENGGRDAASRERMDASTNNFELRLSVSGKPAGEDWGDVEVQIFDAQHNNVVKQRLVGGPLLYLNLPKGSYRVVATDLTGKKSEAQDVIVSPDNNVPLELHIKG